MSTKGLSYFKRFLSHSAFPAIHPLAQSGVRFISSKVGRACYGGRHTVTMLPGDGAGPELMKHVREVFRYAGVPVDFEEVQLDQSVSDEDYDKALLAIRRNFVALKGNVESDLNDPTFKSRNLELRTELELFANIVKVKNIPGLNVRHDGIDIVIIRENTEGEYRQLEHENVKGVVESLKIITEARSTRIAKYAFNYAATHGRKKVTAVHKANIMKQGDGLFLESCRRVSLLYPDIEFDNMIVDNCSMQMVSRPQQFDVMVLPNLYGNIISNIGAGLIGGPGVVAGANIGDKYAIFESGTRNTGKHVAGKNIANPSAMLLASADMLDYLGLEEKSHLIRNAVFKVLSEEMVHTPDVGGDATSMDVVQAVITEIQSKASWKSTHSKKSMDS